MQIGLGIGIPFTKSQVWLAVQAVFTPAKLFESGANGLWLDPSDLTTMFQDSAGTTPVTAVEQPVGLILDKSKGLVLGPELVTNGDFSNGTTGWAYTVAGTSTASISGGQATLIRGNSYCFITQNGVLTADKVYSVTLDVVSTTGTGAIVNNSGVSYASFTTSGTKTFKFRHSSGATSVLYLEAQSGTVVFDNISVREIQGNHAFQSTSANRPTLSARYNLLTKTEDFSDAVWTKSATTISANTIETLDPFGGNNADKLYETTDNQKHWVYESTPNVSGTTYTASFYVKGNGRDWCVVSLYDGANDLGRFFQLTGNGAVGSRFGANGTVTGSITNVGNGWYRCTITTTALASSGNSAVSPASSDGVNSYAGDTSKGLYVFGADLRVTNQSSLPYQRVNTATDYDSAGFPTYLKFDGIDDALQTNSIDFTATDKMTVFAGVRKIGTSIAVPIELSANADTTSGTFNVGAPVAPDTYYTSLRGSSTLSAKQTLANFASPVTSVVQASYALSQPSATDMSVRVNGDHQTLSVASGSPGPAGVGAFGNYPLYIGARAGTSLFFNGHLYQLVIVGKQASPTEITATENYIELKTFGKDMSYVYDYLVDSTGNQITDSAGNPIYVTTTYQ